MGLPENVKVAERSDVGAGVAGGDGVGWKAEWWVHKYNAGAADVRAGKVEPYEVVHRHGNLLLLGGADILWKALTSTLGVVGTTGLKNTVFNNAQASILVGRSTAAAVNTQTDLQATSNSSQREAAPMEATYPLHTTGDSSTAHRDISFRGLFTTAMANFAWNEWGIGNSTSTTLPFPGRLLNRKVEALGTKTASATWTFTVKLTLS